MITKEQAEEIINEHESIYPEPEDWDKEHGRELYAVWQHFWQLVCQEEDLKDTDLIEAFDGHGHFMTFVFMTEMNLHTLGLYKEYQMVAENLLGIQWSNENQCMPGFAKQCIAGAYADMGDLDRCIEQYEEYLSEDDSWGWGWMKYAECFRESDQDRYLNICDMVYNRVIDGEEFYDQEDIIRSLNELYEDIGDYERVRSLQLMTL